MSFISIKHKIPTLSYNKNVLLESNLYGYLWILLSLSLGLTITACPLAPDSKAYEYVEIFSAGWNERPNFAIANRSKAISVEFLRPENGDFSFNWMELIPGPTLSIAGKFAITASIYTQMYTSKMLRVCLYLCIMGI